MRLNGLLKVLRKGIFRAPLVKVTQIQIRALFHRSRKIKIGKSLREKVPKFSPNKLVSISAFGQCPQSALLVIIT